MASCPQPIGAGLDEIIARAAEAVRTRGFARPGSDAAEQVRIDDHLRRLQARGVPYKAALAIAAGLDETFALRRSLAWLDSSPRRQVLVLAGPKDACKTTAASVLVDRWAPWPQTRMDETPIVVAWETILKVWYHKPTEANPRDPITNLPIRDLFTTALLVLDDVGQESATTAEQHHGEVLDILLKTRCDAGKHTALTTNYESPHDTCPACKRLTHVCDADGRCPSARGRKLPTPEDRAKHVTLGLLSRYPARGARIGERLTEFGEWVHCPAEGLRSRERRAAVLAKRGRSGT